MPNHTRCLDPSRSAFPTVLVSLLLALGGLACERQPRQASDETAVETTAHRQSAAPSAARETRENPELDVLARFLAGLEPLPDLLAPEPWAEHAEAMAHLWGELEKRRLDRLRSWAEQELHPRDPRAPLVYPFGGPDFLTAEHFFPQAASYILIGLEPPGEILVSTHAAASQELVAHRSDQLAAALERLRGGFESLLESGYFVTKKMEQDLAGDDLNGVLPMLMIFLARTNKTVMDASYVALDASGAVYDINPGSAASASAVRIAFIDQQDHDSESVPRTLYFFSQDLSNEGLEDAPFRPFLDRLGTFNVYMKSTQYLPHLDDFALLTAELLAQGQTLLQDDSGLPLRFFPEKSWQLHYFGTYTQTLPAYSEFFQESLRQAFASQPDLPFLDFALGYHTRIGGSCLIWAERRERAQDQVSPSGAG